jgi:hypothetical protein
MIAVIFTRGEGWVSGRPIVEQPGLDGHVAFIRDGRTRGLVIEGGPLHDATTEPDDDLVGLALLTTSSIEEARDYIETDPVVQSRAYAYRLYAWRDVEPLRVSPASLSRGGSRKR